MKKSFCVKILKKRGIQIEGAFVIKAKNIKKALKKAIYKSGKDYKVLSIKETE